MRAAHLVVRADGGPGIGSGHLARCLALAQAWVDAAGRVTLASAGPPQDWAERYTREGADVRTPGDAPYDDADWAVIDGYHFTTADQEAVRAAGCRLLSIDDHGRLGRHAADVILDQNLGATGASYRDRAGHADLLLGTRYALLRREFRRPESRQRVTPPVARRLLVSRGGFPSAGAVETFAAVLSDPALAAMEVVDLSGTDDVAAVMAGADLALAASGSTCWELCCTGLPAVLVPVADNQIALARALASSGAAEDAGQVDHAAPARIAGRVADLAGDPARRATMSQVGQGLVDGRGAKRVVARLRADLLNLRPATAADAELLWVWANDPAVRASAFRSAPIPWDQHVDWLSRRLADSTTPVFVASRPDVEPVGVVRFERRGSSAEISITVAANRRGEGWGPALIDAGVRRVFAETSVDEVTARIKPENRASLSSFEDAGFAHVGVGATAQDSWVSYVRPRPEGTNVVGASTNV